MLAKATFALEEGTVGILGDREPFVEADRLDGLGRILRPRDNYPRGRALAVVVGRLTSSARIQSPARALVGSTERWFRPSSDRPHEAVAASLELEPHELDPSAVLVLEGLHPRLSRFVSSLPAMPLVATIASDAGPLSKNMRGHTLFVDCDAEFATLAYTVSFGVLREPMRDLRVEWQIVEATGNLGDEPSGLGRMFASEPSQGDAPRGRAGSGLPFVVGPPAPPASVPAAMPAARTAAIDASEMHPESTIEFEVPPDPMTVPFQDKPTSTSMGAMAAPVPPAPVVLGQAPARAPLGALPNVSPWASATQTPPLATPPSVVPAWTSASPGGSPAASPVAPVAVPSVRAAVAVVPGATIGQSAARTGGALGTALQEAALRPGDGRLVPNTPALVRSAADAAVLSAAAKDGAASASDAAAEREPRADSASTSSDAGSSDVPRPLTQLAYFDPDRLDAILASDRCKAVADRALRARRARSTDRRGAAPSDVDDAEAEAHRLRRKLDALGAVFFELDDDDELDRVARKSANAATVLVTGKLDLPFSEVELLRETAKIAAPIAKDDARLGELVARAQEIVALPVGASGDFVLQWTQQIRDAWSKANRIFPANFLEANVERSLLEQRAHRKLEVLGGQHVRAVLRHARGELVTYLPIDSLASLPLARELSARVLGELHPRQDALESGSQCLRCLAIAHVDDRMVR